MTSQRKQHALEMFEAAAGPLRRGRPRSLSFFQDPRWRRAAVEAVEAGAEDRVLDVACGTGLVSRALVERWGCRVVGLDQSAPMLGRARDDARRATRGWPSGSTLVEGEAERLPFADREFDHLTFTYLLRYVDDPAATLRELARVVKPGGRVSSLEFCVPRGALALALAPLHPGRTAGPGPARLAQLVRGGALPRPQHRGLLPRATRCAARSSSGRRPGSSASRRGG